MFERVDPKTLMKWLIVAAILYFILPWDLIPDFLGLAGRIDDLFVIAWLAWAYRDKIKAYVTNQGAGPGSRQAFEADSASGRQPPSGFGGAEASDRFDAYEILEVTRSSSADAIQSAYRARMMEYHPDKVAHLGVELQKLAHEKSQAIERAYRLLRK
jgi:hypothetical protein